MAIATSTFLSGGGIVTTDFGGADSGGSVILQQDGKIIVAVETSGGGDGGFGVVRYNTDGSLDTTFDGDGKVITAFGGWIGAGSAALQNDGMIVVAGKTVYDGGGGDFALVRYNTNGSLDTSFDLDGKMTTDFGAYDAAASVIVLSDEKILAAGYTGVDGSGGGDFALVRYNTDGSLDSTFDLDGKVTTNFGAMASANSVVEQSGGKIIAVGDMVTDDSGGSDMVLVRYNDDGSLDTTFGNGGKVISDFGYGDFASSAVVQSDDKIIVAGRHYSNGGESGGEDFLLVRYNSNGTLDTTFDHDGIIIADFGGAEYPESVTLQTDGKIVVTGYSAPLGSSGDGDVIVVRYNTDGSLDTTFSDDGVVKTKVGFESSGNGVVVQSDGRILVAGNTDMNGDQDFLLIRYNADGGWASIVVSNTNDSGPGSLRQAIEDLNVQGSSTATVILFAVSGTILIDENNSLPLVAFPVSFEMAGNTVELSVINATSLSSALRVAGDVSVAVPSGLTMTVESTDHQFGIFSSGNILLSGMAGTINVQSANGTDSISDIAMGMASGVNLVINGDFSGSVNVHAPSEAVAVIGENNLSVSGNMSGSLTAQSDDYAIGLKAADADVFIQGDISGIITVSATGEASGSKVTAVGIKASDGNIEIGNISGSMTATGTDIAIGIYAGDFDADNGGVAAMMAVLQGDVTINGTLSGGISATSSGGMAFGIAAEKNLIIGDVASSASIEIEGNSAAGFGSFYGDVFVLGNVAGTFDITAIEDARAIGAAGNITITGDMSATITVNGSEVNAGESFGIAALPHLFNEQNPILLVDGSNITIGGAVAGTVTVHSSGDDAGGIVAGNNLSISGGVTGTISADAVGEKAGGLYAAGAMYGGDALTSLSVSGAVSAQGGNLVAGIMAGGGMNIEISGTVSGTATSGNGYALLSGTIEQDTFQPSIAVTDRVNVTGTGRLVGGVDLGDGEDTMVLEGNADVSGVAVLDGGAGKDKLKLIGNATVDLNAHVTRTRNFEMIDVTDGMGTSLSHLSFDNVITLTDADHDLYIHGDNGDQIELDDASGAWMFDSMVVIEGIEYKHYNNNSDTVVDLYVQNGVTIIGESSMVGGSTESWLYLASYSDLMAAFGADSNAAAWHYNTYGKTEGRTMTFDAWGYLASWADLRGAFGTNLGAAAQHYVEYGRNEGRTITFDAWGYLASWADLRGAFGTDLGAATRHYVEYGANEGRTMTFDAWNYLASWDDLLNAFGSDLGAATHHYVAYGANEGRTLSFDTEGYLLSYDDLHAAFGTDTHAAILHYVNYGYHEGRHLVSVYGAPVVSSFTPVDGAVAVSLDSNIILTFNESIHRGTGSIELHAGSSTGALVESYDVATSTHLTVSGTTLTINPADDLARGTHYYVTLTSGSIKDLSGNSYAGTSSYDFISNPNLIGTAAGETLMGGSGNETISALGGNDTLNGGAGADLLIGGEGGDTLVFSSASDIGLAAGNRDVISDFTAGQDLIDLSSIDANSDIDGNQVFSSTILGGSGLFSSAGQLRYDSAEGLLYGNTDSDVEAEFAIQLLGLVTLNAGDLVL